MKDKYCNSGSCDGCTTRPENDTVKNEKWSAENIDVDALNDLQEGIGIVVEIPILKIPVSKVIQAAAIGAGAVLLTRSILKRRS